MRRVLTIAAVTILTLLTSVAVTTPARADVCGDTVAQWVPTGLLSASTWAGELDLADPLDTFVLETIAPLQAAVTLLGVEPALIPLVGEWEVATADQQMAWVGGLEGYLYHFSVHADACAGGKVTEASGGGFNELNESFTIDLTRVV